MFGLGKKRSKLGKWLDRRGMNQTWLAKHAKINRNTVNNLCSGDNENEPNQRTMKKILKAIREIDPSVRSNDFWDM